MAMMQIFITLFLCLTSHPFNNIQFGSADRIFFPGEERLTLGSPCTISPSITGTCKFYGNCQDVSTNTNGELVFCSTTDNEITVCCPDVVVRIDNRKPTSKPYISAPYLFWDPVEVRCGSLWDADQRVAEAEGEGIVDIYYNNELADQLRSEGFNVTVLEYYGDVIMKMTYSNSTFSNTTGYFVIQQIPSVVVGGHDAPPTMALFMALIGQREGDSVNWVCDGVVLNREWILTAAHCFIESGIQPDIVRLGDYDWKRLNESKKGYFNHDFGIADLILYPEFNPNERYHDIALVKLSKPYPMFAPNINPICLPWDKETNVDIVGFNVTLTGWGSTEYAGGLGENTNILQAVELEVFDTSVCKESYSKNLDYRFKWPQGMSPNTSLCVGWEAGGRDACKGDSGGPLNYLTPQGYTLAGIVSVGSGCGLEEFPGIYVPINNHVYLAWIKSVAFKGFDEVYNHVEGTCWDFPIEDGGCVPSNYTRKRTKTQLE